MTSLERVYFPSRIISRHVGGNTTYARELAAGLAKRGIAVGTLRSLPSAPMTALIETWQGAAVKGELGDVLHYSADTGPLLRTRRPSVVTVHGVASRWITTARTPRQESIWRTRVRRAIKSTDAIITVSDSSARDVAAVFDVDPEVIVTIPHGIDTAGFARPRELSPRLSHLADRPFVLYLGNIEPRKNLIELVRAFKHPTLAESGVKLVIAGKPAWNADESLAAIQAAGVEYLGFVDDEERVALLQQAQLFVFPSLYEGFGFPVLEALAAGTPVLCSNRGSLPEVAGPSFVLEDVSAEGISSGVIAALSDDAARRAVADSGPRWAQNVSWDASVAAHVAVYERAMNR